MCQPDCRTSARNHGPQARCRLTRRTAARGTTRLVPQQEVGPYTFQAVKVKRQVEFVRGGDAVRYHEYRYFRPLPELSNGSLSDPITTLNVPLVGESCGGHRGCAAPTDCSGRQAGGPWPVVRLCRPACCCILL